MAYETGFADDHADLWAKLLAFLTTNEDLVAVDQEWVSVWDANDGDDVVLRGPGLAEADQIYVGMKLVRAPLTDASGIDIVGMQGVLPAATAFNEHVNVTPVRSRMFLSNTTMEYWFVANGRRFIVVVKMSTVYEAMYGGLYLPYANPVNYSYPLFVGASSGQSGTAAPDWHSVLQQHTHFVKPDYKASNPGSYESNAWALMPDGQWLRCGAWSDGADLAMAPYRYGTDPLGASDSNGVVGYLDILNKMAAGYGSTFGLTPLTLVRPSLNWSLGRLDGCFHIAGRDNAVRDIVTIDTTDYFVVQNAFRTGIGDFWALALE